jgi:hypothetical protein
MGQDGMQGSQQPQQMQDYEAADRHGPILKNYSGRSKEILRGLTSQREVPGLDPYLADGSKESLRRLISRVLLYFRPLQEPLEEKSV